MGKTAIFIFVVFIISLVVFWFGIDYFYKKQIDKYLLKKTNEFEIVYSAVQNSFDLVA